jgi:hypothetical protein
MIPVGTLCITVRSCSSRVEPSVYSVPDRWSYLGRICEVTSIPVAAHNVIDGFECVVRFAHNGLVCAMKYRNLRPIAPPGNPDAEWTRDNRPEEVAA